jgi:hypothetical protein
MKIIKAGVRVCSCERGPVFRVPIGDIKTRQVPFVWFVVIKILCVYPAWLLSGLDLWVKFRV